MVEIFIRSKELSNILAISSDELIEIQKKLDSVKNDKLKLIQGKDYKVVNRHRKLREYTLSGAYKIAYYLKLSKRQDMVDVIKQWFINRHKDIRIAFVKKKILDNCSSLVKRNGQFFISHADAAAILGTRSDYLFNIFKYIQHTQFALIKGQDYDSIGEDGIRHYSLFAIHKLAEALREKLSEKSRKEWCAGVREVIAPQVSEIVVQILSRDRQVKVAKDKARNRDNQACQVCGKKGNSIDRLNLETHHLYSKNEYPHLADVENNLITLTEEIHEQFHEYMGGSVKPCTIDDFINFVQEYYPTNTKIIIWLQKQKLVLGNQQPLNNQKSHVLALPASRVI